MLGAVAGDASTEMPRNSERSFCCGAGGARMWMEEKIGKRINIERVEEAIATGAKTIAVGCPFCSTMIGDGVTGKKRPATQRGRRGRRRGDGSAAVGQGLTRRRPERPCG